MSRIFLLVLVLALTSCAPAHKPLPVGEVPGQQELSSSDEAYGHEVLGAMLDRYPLDRDDQRIARVRNIVDRLAAAAHVQHNPWHAYVLVGDDVRNAAATRGNVVMIWTGMLSAVRDDHELAGILAHEMAHVLADHTTLNAREQTGKILGSVAGDTAANILIQQSAAMGAVAGIAAALAGQLIEAALVNPETQIKELEADQIGLFLMADAKFDPRKALDFWSRVQNDPGFNGGTIQFLSSHPSSAERIEQIERILPEALDRYHGRRSAGAKERRGGEPRRLQQGIRERSPAVGSSPAQSWTVAEPFTSVYESPSTSSSEIGILRRGSRVEVIEELHRWLRINAPLRGYVIARDLSPEH